MRPEPAAVNATDAVDAGSASPPRSPQARRRASSTLQEPTNLAANADEAQMVQRELERHVREAPEEDSKPTRQS